MSACGPISAHYRRRPGEPRKRPSSGFPGEMLGHLAEDLDGLCRLRVGRHRFIWRYHSGGIRVFYAAPRKTVYEYLAAHLREVLSES
jgi:hypothetical protein